MTLYATDWSITSDITPEWAVRVSRDGALVWRLSWLPGLLLTHGQAAVGMKLDELLSVPDGVYDRRLLVEADACAGHIGLTRASVVMLLVQRVAAQLRDAWTTAAERGAALDIR
ncbi:hypothetical protein [Nocardia sp. NPDC051570]|uniref:hypothetical protein n=1 Tax=Nocardia sp. NPDC051570 TaxID=3364324 RepID=UPI0037B51444